jgi:hypothetical protein
MKETKDADKWFSIFIRLRDAGKEGLTKCPTCNHYFNWKQMECSHFISRKHNSTRFSEKNTISHCHWCNSRHNTDEKPYENYLIYKHGQELVDELRQLKNATLKLSAYDLEDIAYTYFLKSKELAKEKGLSI